MFTIAGLWWPILLAILLALAIWYWSQRVSHRLVEKISERNPEIYNFRFLEQRRQQRRRK